MCGSERGGGQLTNELAPRVTESDYTLAEHRHRYAAWSAARAVQRDFKGASNSLIREALGASDLPGLLASSAKRWPATARAFDRAHRQWCQQIVDNLAQAGVETSFGRAAKVAAIYIKTLVVVGGHADSPLAQVAHPPIDAILLKCLAKQKHCRRDHRNLWRDTAWTKLEADDYYALIATLRAEGLDQPSFWTLERFWLA